MSASNPSLKEDYVGNAPALRPFYQYPIQQPDFAQIFADKSGDDIDRHILAEVIREQYSGLELFPAEEENLRLLIQDRTFTITTGHQLVIFGGPLFTLYKVLSTIQLAEKLNREHPEYQVVPIFWIHTEDHDFEEINHYFRAFDKKMVYPGTFHGAVGRHILEPSIQALIPEGLDEDLASCFAPGRSLAQAMRSFFHLLLGEKGLLILDPDDHRLKKRFQRVIEDELFDQHAHDLVKTTNRQLHTAGYPVQVHPREINLFYLDDDSRSRLVREKGGFRVLERDLHFSEAEMRTLIQEHPERFSPNVTLRPLYQEMILPNLAYFGGWGEISYWLQLKAVFDHFGVNYPLVLPRFSALLFPSDLEEEWRGMGFEPQDVQRPVHDLYRQFMPQVWEDDHFRELSVALLAAYDRLGDYIKGEISESLSRSAAGQRRKAEKFLANYEKKIHRVIRHDHPDPFAAINHLKMQVQPDGLVQERVLSMLSFPEWPVRELVALVARHCLPISFSTHCIPLRPEKIAG